MKLRKTHRQAFLSELAKANEDLSSNNRCLIDCVEKEQFALARLFEVSIFLIQERIKLIEKSLIENEIDF